MNEWNEHKLSARLMQAIKSKENLESFIEVHTKRVGGEVDVILGLKEVLITLELYMSDLSIALKEIRKEG